jgi:dolichyl-diphosphooligosaccharide--protein glycosyltransferase
VGATGNLIDNSSQPLALSYAWLATQDSNLPVQDKPAYVSWWDYGFQELQEGLHPSVADDFQQGYEAAGQILLAQNQSQILALFIARTIQAEFVSSQHSFNTPVNNVLTDFFGSSETSLLASISQNPLAYQKWIFSNPSEYGNYASPITSTNAYFALITGQLASKYSMNTLVNAYTALSQVTGISIKYIQVPNTLFPSSINNTGTFYAPAYLTDTPSYVSTGGAIVPTNYYNILVQTTNGTYTLNNVPTGANVTGESLQYTSAFYNTTIYRLQIGYPGSAVGLSSGIPGLAAGATNYTIMPAWDMSNFEIVYELIPWNPYTDYAAHPNAWQDIPLQQAYYDLVNGIGTPVIFPSTSDMVSTANPIVAYYPGAIITGRVTTPGGSGVGGINVTLFDQYGIPHDVVQTNSAGYYNITAVPGNDTVVFSTGTLNSLYLYGKNVIKTTNVYVSSQQAERTVLGVNMTTDLPNYYITENYQIPASEISGTAYLTYQTVKNANATIPGNYISKPVESGTIFLVNSTFGVNISIPLVEGSYKLPDVLPYDYELSLLTGGTYYPNLTQADVGIGSNVAFDAQVSFDSIFVNTTTASGLSGGYTVKASDGSVVYSNTTNNEGHATLWVLPGTYTIQAYKSSSQTDTSTTTFTDWGQNYSVNLSASLSGMVQGTLSGAPSGTVLYFYPNGQISSAYSTMIGAGGAFSAEVPYGVYTLYAKSNGNSFARTITVQSNVTVTGYMSLGYPLTVSAPMPGITAYSGSYEFMGGSAYLEYSYSGPTTYTIMLPEGMYGISAQTVYLGSIKEGFQNIYLVGARNVSLKQQYTNTVTITLSESGNSGAKVNSGISILNSSGNPVYFGTVSSGLSTLYYLNGSKDLSTYAMSSLYTSSAVSLSSTTQSYYMTPVSVGITISFVNRSVELKGTTNLVLRGPNTYYLSGSEGGVSASVSPGIYTASASNLTATLNISDPVIVVPNIGSQSISLSATPYGKLSVNTTDFMIFNSAGIAVRNNEPLPAGNYLVYAYTNSSSSPEASWESYFINSNLNVTPSLQSAESISLSNSLGISGGAYTLSIDGGIANLSTSSVYLNPGTYSVKYYNTITNATGSYVVSGSESFDTYYGTAFNVIVSSTRINTVLTGTVTYNGKAMQDTVIMIMSSHGTFVARSVTNTYGIYSVSVPTGSWAIYALNNISGTGYYGGVTIPAFSGTYYDNFSLKPAYSVTVIVTVDSKVYDTNVEVTLYPNNINVNSSNANLILPLGNYSFSAGINQTATAYNGSIISVSYSTNSTIYVNSNTSVVLALSQVITGQISISQNGAYPSLATGDNLTNSTEVYFNVTNDQNVEQSVTLASGSKEWHILFNQSYLNLAPGQKVAVSAIVYALGNPPSGTQAVPVNLTYSGTTVTDSFSVSVVPRADFTATLNSPFGIPQNGKLAYNITLTNTGNSPITINGSIMDQQTIRQYDWNAVIMYNSKASGTFTLAYGQSLSLAVILTPNGSAYAEGAPIKLDFSTTSYSSNITVPITFNVEYPYASVSPFPQGQGIISNYTGNPLSAVVTGLLVIAVTVIGGIAIAVYRGRRFRR